jgi:uncharacterized protein
MLEIKERQLRGLAVRLLVLLIVVALAGCSHPNKDAALDRQLLQAIREGNTGRVRIALSKGAHVDARDPAGNTALALAVDYGHRDAAGVLLNAGASLASAELEGDDALLNAARDGAAHRVEFLLSRHPNLSARNDALFAAATHAPLIVQTVQAESPLPVPSTPMPTVEDEAATATVLLTNGAEIEARDQQGATPLIEAAMFGNTQVVRVLLDNGADVGAKDNSGETALIAAACECASIDMPATLDSLKLLVERRADINARDKQRQTALMAAALAGQTGNVRYLLDSGAELDIKDNWGNTALLLAAGAGEYNAVGVVETTEVVKLLLARGANPRVTNRHGDDAIALARKSHRYRIVSILRAAENR